MRIYTGIGSRNTPDSICTMMRELARVYADRRWILRSGGATGADTAFEDGAIRSNGVAQIFHRKYWMLHQGSGKRKSYNATLIKEASEIASITLGGDHWDRCNYLARQFHTRNVFQILGPDLQSPSELVVCWTPQAREVGGTATALKIARQRDIPIYNLADEDIEDQVRRLISGQSQET